MTDEEKVRQVTDKLLAGKFYIGQSVRHRASHRTGHITDVAYHGLDSVILVYVRHDNGLCACQFPGEVETL